MIIYKKLVQIIQGNLLNGTDMKALGNILHVSVYTIPNVENGKNCSNGNGKPDNEIRKC